MTTCCVKFCGNNTKSFFLKSNGIAFYRFPKDPEMRAKWVQASGRPNWTPTHFSVVCARHFAEDCYSKKCRRVLLDTAVPTLHLPSNNGSVMRSEEINKQASEQKNLKEYQVVQENNNQVYENGFEFVLVAIPDGNIENLQDNLVNLSTEIARQDPNSDPMMIVKQGSVQSQEHEPEKAPQQPLEQLSEQSSGQTTEQSSVASSEQSPEQSSEQSTEQSSEQSSDQSSEQSLGQNSEHSQEQSSGQPLEQSANLDAEQTTEYIPNLVPQYIPNQLPQYIPNQIIQFIPNQVPQFITNQIPDYLTQPVPEYITNQVPEYVTNPIPDYMNQIPEFIANQIPQFIINQVPEYVLGPVPEYVTNQTPEYISSQVPQYLPNQVLDQNSQIPKQSNQLQPSIKRMIEELSEVPTINAGTAPTPQFDYDKPQEIESSINEKGLCARIKDLEEDVLKKNKTVKRLRNQVCYLKTKIRILESHIKRYQDKENRKIKYKTDRNKGIEEIIRPSIEKNKEFDNKDNNRNKEGISMEIEYLSDQLVEGITVNTDQTKQATQDMIDANIQT